MGKDYSLCVDSEESGLSGHMLRILGKMDTDMRSGDGIEFQ